MSAAAKPRGVFVELRHICDNVFEWADPPPSINVGRSQPGLWYALVSQLLEKPNTWARLRHYEGVKAAWSISSALTCGKVTLPDIPDEDGRFEFTARKTDDGGGDIYGRYTVPTL